MIFSRLCRGRSSLRQPLSVLSVLLCVGCGDSGTGTGPSSHSALLDAVFAPPSPAEVEAIAAEWAGRPEPAAVAGLIVYAAQHSFGQSAAHISVLSHRLDGNLHYGAVIVPAGGTSRKPVIVYLHPGDDGVDADLLTVVIPLLLREEADNFVYVIPSFRSEPLRAGGSLYTSEGAPSPWDRDVDDAMSFLTVALQTVLEADPERIAALGYSRGGGVALLMGIRDDRIDAIIEFAGPTDFFGSYVRDLVSQALGGRIAALPGMADLNQRFIRPLALGTLSIDDFRRELVRRSPTLFAESLPPTQVHHGTQDMVVSVSQAQRLQAELSRLGRLGVSDEVHLYYGLGHDLDLLSSGASETIDFLRRNLAP